MRLIRILRCTLIVALCVSQPATHAGASRAGLSRATASGDRSWASPRYDMGSPHLRPLFVDYRHGSDAADGSAPDRALRTLDAAWRALPSHATLKTGYRILLAPGDYPESALPTYWQSRYGTFSAPIVVQAAAGAHSVRLHGYLNIYDTRYLYLIGLDVLTDRGYGGGGDVIHLEKTDHILIRDCTLNGFDGTKNQPQETLKANQSRYLFVEDSDIGGAYWFAVDTMAVQYGHITGSRVHRAGDDCMVLKGGSTSFLVDDDEIFDCAEVGMSAGEGSGLEFLVRPWFRFEAYNMVFVNDIVHDTSNAGLAARGAFDVAFVGNTLYRVGTDQHAGSALMLFAFGMRGCGHPEVCRANSAQGAWGSAVAGDGLEVIPNRNVYVYDNLVVNPPPARTMYSQIAVAGPAKPPAGLHLPPVVHADDDLRLQGNVIWNGPADLELGPEEPDQGCRPANSTCNPAQLRADNAWNAARPGFVDATAGDFHVRAGTLPAGASTVPVPEFPAGDRAGAGLPSESFVSADAIGVDRDGHARKAGMAPGAYVVQH